MVIQALQSKFLSEEFSLALNKIVMHCQNLINFNPILLF